MSNHPIHASIDILCHKIDELLEAWKLDYIYVATEDESYCKYLKERYGDRVTFTDQERCSIEPGGMLSHMYVFFASTFWTKLQNIFGHYCKSKLDKVAKPRLAAILPAA